MKLHLLFVFLLAAPLIGRMFSSDAATSAEACDSTSSKSAEVRVVPAPDPAPEIRAVPLTPATAKPAKPAPPRAHAFMFM